MRFHNHDCRARRRARADNESEYLPLEPSPLGPGDLSFAKGVLVLDDLIRHYGLLDHPPLPLRYRSGPHAADRSDSAIYSRTCAHHGFELSWNLVTGKLITRELHLNEKGGDAAYDPIVEKTTLRKSGKVWLFDTPDPETLMEQVRGR